MKSHLLPKLKTLFACIVLLASFNINSFAQMYGNYSAAANKIVSQQFMNNMMMNQRMMMSSMWLNNANYLINPVYKFEVKDLNDSVQYIRSKIYTDTTLHKSYLLKINRKEPSNSPNRKEKIYADQTKMISRESVSMEGASIGIATDSCWQFKVISGKINAFSFLSETFNISTFNLSAFQVGEGVIQPLNPKELEKIIVDVPRAKKAFDKKDYYKAITIYNQN